MSVETVKSVQQKSPRHRARELALQGIYQWRVSGTDASDIETHLQGEKNLGRYDKPMYARLLRGVLDQHEALAVLLTPYLDRALDELSTVEFSVLLLAAFELSQQPDVPYKVVINEAVELAKTFGGTDGHKYVNGVLDKLAPKVRAVEFANNGK
ncbi:MAG: transcription antitermination factor NusB [Proteobacteria bacterium]|nr:transcription antitermination factor NusB [Pseudomonadota bacterium]